MSIDPHPDLIEHGRRLLEIPDLRDRLRYYNDNIYSLSFPYNKGFAGWNNDGLHVFGEEDDGHGYGEVFFRRNNRTDPSSLSIYFEERQREVDRVKRLVIEEPMLNLWPWSKDEVSAFNNYLIGLFNDWRENPGKYHWLWSPSFEVFDFDTCFVLSLTC